MSRKDVYFSAVNVTVDYVFIHAVVDGHRLGTLYDGLFLSLSLRATSAVLCCRYKMSEIANRIILKTELAI